MVELPELRQQGELLRRGERIGRGTYVTVYQREGVSADIRSQLGDSDTGYVVKCYNQGRFPPSTRVEREQAAARGESLGEIIAPHDAHGAARMLAERQNELRRFMGDDFDRFILPAHTATEKDKSGKDVLCETQVRLENLVDVQSIGNAFSLTIDVATFFPEQQARLKKEVQAMIAMLERFYTAFNQEEALQDEVFSEAIPDFHPANIAFLPDGRLAIFDTNHWGERGKSAPTD